MNDTKWSNIDEELYKLLLKHFKLDLIKNNEIYKYHGFRNDVIDLFIKESEQWTLITNFDCILTDDIRTPHH